MVALVVVLIISLLVSSLPRLSLRISLTRGFVQSASAYYSDVCVSESSSLMLTFDSGSSPPPAGADAWKVLRINVENLNSAGDVTIKRAGAGAGASVHATNHARDDSVRSLLSSHTVTAVVPDEQYEKQFVNSTGTGSLEVETSATTSDSVLGHDVTCARVELEAAIPPEGESNITTVSALVSSLSQITVDLEDSRETTSSTLKRASFSGVDGDVNVKNINTGKDGSMAVSSTGAGKIVLAQVTGESVSVTTSGGQVQASGVNILEGGKLVV